MKKGVKKKSVKKRAVKESNDFVSNTKAFDNYGKGWKVMASGFWTLVAVGIVAFLIDFVRGFFKSGLLSFLISVFVVGPITFGSAWVFLKAARKDKYSLGDMFSVFKRNYLNIVVANLLMIIFVFVGLILLIIPGIIVAVRLAFVPYFAVDRKMKGMESIKASWRMTKGHSWTIFGMYLLAIPIALLGVICLFVGVFVSIAWIGSSFAVLYHSVSLKKGKK